MHINITETQKQYRHLLFFWKINRKMNDILVYFLCKYWKISVFSAISGDFWWIPLFLLHVKLFDWCSSNFLRRERSVVLEACPLLHLLLHMMLLVWDPRWKDEHSTLNFLNSIPLYITSLFFFLFFSLFLSGCHQEHIGQKKWI